MIADATFIVYLIFTLIICVIAFFKDGKELQWEFLAFRDTQRYMHSKGLRWPPREWLD